ncbi:trehalose-phosphatase [Tessaracoccus sp. MC1865]|uniref:trehalose-phosphatase n=1 Tax=Tessaracoccus sp. MC1865 TaxID=2760310 RepID=UPI0016011E17|nr:trehalose-phosphatase [Tessaracoccus sp. MC1865]MBB1483402.1 trehalose-phosphatase [Tessaracoccus sp. MC1865]QTO36508.1 trehalose-phosphatase [Tessaracoccus sp. MC1865]
MTWNAVTDHAQSFFSAAAADPSRVLLALDFDGTLAPIVDDPEDSRMHDGAAQALARLGGVLGHVAIITGRGVAVVRRLGRLAEREGLGNLVVLGQYGAERWDAATGEETPPSVPENVAAARPEVERIIAGCTIDGVVLEDKGRALGVHTRRSADPDAAFRLLEPQLAVVAARHGLVLEPGRNVLELRASALTKGDALLALVDETGATVVAMCGDDLGDLPAFEVLRELRDGGLSTCAVISGSAEQPAMAAQADVLAEGPDGVAAWLRDLAAALA